MTDTPTSAVEALHTRVAALERYVQTFEAACAATVERIERLEPAHVGAGEGDIAVRRAALGRLGPFHASTHDTDTILANDGRRFLVLLTAVERDVVLQALNDAWIAAQ